MKIKSVSGFTCYVKNLKKTARFYEALGFEVRKQEPDHITVYSNWFWIDFLDASRPAAPGLRQAAAAGKGAGLFIYLSVDDVDRFHKELSSKGLKPATQPQDRLGNREFVLPDPDGYNLVIFKRK